VTDDDSKPPMLKVVSENPNARADRQIVWATEEAQRTLSVFAASLLRIMAGSASEATYLMHRLAQFVDALKELNALSGRGLTSAELEEALRLPRADRDFSRSDDWAYRHWLREHGLDIIVQGALRLAAHKVLDERPHFGGKYSEDVIEDGIKTLGELKRPPPKLQPQSRSKGLTTSWDDIDLGPRQPKGKESQSNPRKSVAGSGRAISQRQGFGPEDLKELRKAIKAKDQKRIIELTAKIGRPSFED
jgi:hypothetical protein